MVNCVMDLSDLIADDRLQICVPGVTADIETIMRFTLQDLNFRKNTLICCIYRNGKVILPGGQDMMLAGDSVLVVISGYRISDIKEILED